MHIHATQPRRERLSLANSSVTGVVWPNASPGASHGRAQRQAARPPTAKSSRRAPFEPGDEQVGEYKRDQLLAMNAKFCARLEAAFAAGGESRESAAQAYAIPSRNLVELIAFPSLLR